MKKRERGFAHIFVLILLLAGLGTGVYLVSQKTNFLPKAYLARTLSGPISGPVTSTPTPALGGNIGIGTSGPTPTTKPSFLKEFNLLKPCGNGQYRGVSYTCQNGKRLGAERSYCLPEKDWRSEAEKNCQGPQQARPTSTPTPTSIPLSCTSCDADANRDGNVDTSDFSLIQYCQSKAPTGSCLNADINKDGRINDLDRQCWQKNLGSQCKENLSRQMTVIIRAWGQSYAGNPVIALMDGGRYLQQYTITSTTKANAQTFTYTFPQGQIFREKPTVRFLNDYYRGVGMDRNAYIDYIEVNRVRYESEDQRTFMGSCAWGYLRREDLGCNGFFRYDGYGQSVQPTTIVLPTSTPRPTATPTIAPTSTPRPTATPTLVPPTPTPSLLPVSSSYKRVFITGFDYPATAFTSSSAYGIEMANKICQGWVNNANLGGTWKAWLSYSTSTVASRFNHYNGPYKLLNGITIANNWADLTDGTIQYPIQIGVDGKTVGGSTLSVWTGTTSNGLATTDNCNNWSTTAGSGMAGNMGSMDSWWTQSGGRGCNMRAFLYCFEQ